MTLRTKPEKCCEKCQGFLENAFCKLCPCHQPEEGCCSKCIIPLDYKPAQCNDGECECHQTEKEVITHALSCNCSFCSKLEIPRPSSEEWEKSFDERFFGLFKEMNKYSSGQYKVLTTEKKMKDFIRQTLAHQKQEIVEMVRGKKFEIKVGDYLPLVEDWDGKNFDVPFDHGYRTALTDILETITKEK